MRVFDQFTSPPPARLKPDLSRWQEQQLAAVWIGHATILLRVGGKTILTDPVFSNRVGIGLGLVTAGPMRLVAPALSVDQLPPIDLILLSHSHFDHLDRPSLAQLNRKTPLITAPRMADLVHDLGFRDVTALRWGESHTVFGIKFTAREVNHWGARIFLDAFRGYNGYLIETAKDRVLYAGDTAYTDAFKTVDGVDLAIFGIGAYDPYVRAHATPEQVWEMVNHARATRLLPMHHSTFRLSFEPTEEPLQRLLQAAGTGMDRIVIREIGGQWTR